MSRRRVLRGAEAGARFHQNPWLRTDGFYEDHIVPESGVVQGSRLTGLLVNVDSEIVVVGAGK